MNALGVLAAVEALGGDIARGGAGARRSGRRRRGAARAGRCCSGPGGLRRRDHADRRELQRQPGGDGGGARGLRRRAAARTASAGSRAGGASPSSATCWSSGRASASCTPGLAGVPALAAVTTVHCAGPRMRALYERAAGGAARRVVRRPPRTMAARAPPAGRRRRHRHGQGLARLAGRPGGRGDQGAWARRARRKLRRDRPQMLYYLAELSQNLSVLNVFRYITFRAGGAFFTALRLRLPLRPAADRAAARPPGPRPADPQRRAGEPHPEPRPARRPWAGC